MEGNFLNEIKVVCRRPDSNRHGSPHHPLKMACLPSSTTSAASNIIEKDHGFGNNLVEEAGIFSRANLVARVASVCAAPGRRNNFLPHGFSNGFRSYSAGTFMFSCYYAALALYFIGIWYLV